MSDVFLSYARADVDAASTLAAHLEAAGLSVWWDHKIPAGRTFNEVIQEQLEAAGCIVVLWSSHSIDSDWVLDEAEEGRQRKCLVPVRIGDTRPPLGFRRFHAPSLPENPKSWPRQSIEQIRRAIRDTIGKDKRPAPEPAATRAPAVPPAPKDRWLDTGPGSLISWATLGLTVAQVLVFTLPLLYDFDVVENPISINALLIGVLLVGVWVGIAGSRCKSWAMLLIGWGIPAALVLLPSPSNGLLDLLGDEDLGLLLYLLIPGFLMSIATRAWSDSRKTRHRAPRDASIWNYRRLLGQLIFHSLSVAALAMAWNDEIAGTVLLLLLRASATGLLIVGASRIATGRSMKHPWEQRTGLIAVLVGLALVGGNASIRVEYSEGSLPGSTVKLSGLSLVTYSYADGSANLPLIPISIYTASAELEGFQTEVGQITAWPIVPRPHLMTLQVASSNEARPFPANHGLLMPLLIALAGLLGAITSEALLSGKPNSRQRKSRKSK